MRRSDELVQGPAFGAYVQSFILFTIRFVVILVAVDSVVRLVLLRPQEILSE